MENINLTNDNNINLIYTKVFLEGIEVPYANVSVSYGISAEPSCSISLPGDESIRNLPECTKVLVIYKNPHEGIDGEWYVLFDGELNSLSYTIDSTGSSVLISAIHCSKYLDLMQMIIQEASAAASGMDNIAWGGGTQVGTIGSNSMADSLMIENLFGVDSISKLDTSNVSATNSNFKSMGDFLYALIKSILNLSVYGISSENNTTKYYAKKIIDEYKLPDRIVGIKNTDVIDKTIQDKAKNLATN